MLKVTRREMLRWGLATVGATVLAACAPKVEPTVAPKEAPKAEAPTAAQPAPAGAITLRFMTRQGDMGAAQREFATRYANESGGKIVVESEDTDWNEIPKKYETQLVAGTPPDLAVMDTAYYPYLAKRGSFLVIEDLVAEAKIDLAKWFNIAWMKRWTDGKLSGLGERAGINQIITFYNKDWVMDAWGKEPTDDWTMDDYVECMAACVKKKGDGYYGGNNAIGGGHVADGWVRNWGGYYMDADGKKSLLTEEKCKVGLKWLADQVKNKNYPTREAGAEGENKMFFGGKQAMIISNPGATTGMLAGAEANKINMGMCLAPKGPSAMENPPRRAFIPYANCECIAKGSKYPKETFGMLVRCTSVEALKWIVLTKGSQPGAVLDSWTDPEVVAKYPIFPKVAELMKACTDIFPVPANTRYIEWRDIGNNEIPPLIYGDVEFNDANLNAVNDHLQEIIDQPEPKSFGGK
jgi:ABC-type glycerol-3-phosphate transport system substrate-binding protein